MIGLRLALPPGRTPSALASHLARQGWFFRAKSLLGKALIYLLLIDGAFIFVLPILYMAVVSLFTPEDLVDASIRWLPVHFHWRNYLEAFQRLHYLRSAGNTLFLTTIGLVGQLFCCSLAGYALSRMDFRWRGLLFGAVLLVMVIPAQAMTIPYYVFFAKLKWIDTVLPLTVPELLGNGLYGGLFVFVFRQVFAGIPKDLEEAAAIDGAGVFKAFRLVVMPMAKSAYATVGLFSFVWHWNEYARPIMFLSGETRTLTLALGSLFDFSFFGPRISLTVQGAGVILVMAPVVLGYLFVQRYFIQGVQMTGIKG